MLRERIAEPVKCLYLKQFASGEARGKVESHLADVALLGSSFAKQIDFGRTAAAVGEPPGVEANAGDDARMATSALVAIRASSPALASTPGGSPTAAAVLPKSICFAKLLPKSATSARWDSTFPRASPEANCFKYRHLTGSAMRSRSILLSGV